MSKLHAVLLLALCMSATVFAKCGVERWNVKTGTDPDAGSVDTSAPLSDVATLIGYTAPSDLPDDSRIKPQEFTTVTLKVTLTGYKQEDDSDYHLTIQDSNGNGMIAEIPSPNCVGAGSPFLSAITQARAAFDAQYNVTTSFQTCSDPVLIQGVLFFDFLHGQRGVAPNGMELHPVLNIQWLNQTQQAQVDAALAAGLSRSSSASSSEPAERPHHRHQRDDNDAEAEDARHRARREQHWGAQAPLHVRDNLYDAHHGRTQH